MTIQVHRTMQCDMPGCISALDITGRDANESAWHRLLLFKEVDLDANRFSSVAVPPKIDFIVCPGCLRKMGLTNALPPEIGEDR
jgi:hypothetical protein